MNDNDGQMIFWDLGGLKLPDICLTGEEKPRKNLTQESCPGLGSNTGPLRDRRTFYHLFHSGGLYSYFKAMYVDIKTFVLKGDTYIFFYSLLFRDASTSLVISRLGSFGCVSEGCVFLLLSCQCFIC